MSRSSETIPVSRTDSFQLALMPGRYEKRFREGILAALLVLFAVAVWRYAPSVHDPLFLITIGLLFPLLWCLLQPINGRWRDECIRYDGSGWWLGSRDQWSRLDLVSYRCVGSFLVVLRCRDGEANLTFWLFPASAADPAHRRLRVWLSTQSPD